jgi:trans-aconitate 2-methyltransferase
MARFETSLAPAPSDARQDRQGKSRPPSRRSELCAPAFKWNPKDYADHATAQRAWATELIGCLALRGEEWVLDVGCGDGHITAELARALPRGGVTGLDSSPEMIRYAMARYRGRAHRNLEFIETDARAFRLPRRYDLVFSNAALHWVDDHPAFLRSAAGVLRSGGRLVVSCGGLGNADDFFGAVRAEMRMTAWRGFFRRMGRHYFFHSPEKYATWLPQAGFRADLVRLVEKDTAHAGRDGLAAWMRTTWLPYTQRVPEAQREEFIRRVVGRYLAKHPADAAGQAHVRMVRLEIEAVRL